MAVIIHKWNCHFPVFRFFYDNMLNSEYELNTQWLCYKWHKSKQQAYSTWWQGDEHEKAFV